MMSQNTLLQNSSEVQIDLNHYSKENIHYISVEPALKIEDYSDDTKPAKPQLNKSTSELAFLRTDIGQIERSRRLDSVYVLISPYHLDPKLYDLQCDLYNKLLFEMGFIVDQIECEEDLVTAVLPPDSLMFEAAEDTLLGMPMFAVCLDRFGKKVEFGGISISPTIDV